MALNADDLPREGMAGQQLIDSLTERVGANNTLDVIMKNLPSIARRMGARRPDYHPSHQELNMSSMARNQQPPTPPKPEDMPDTPKGLHTPPAKMMPGANTEPGKMISKEDMESFNKKVSEVNVPRINPNDELMRNPYVHFEQPIPRRPSYVQQIPQQPQKPTYFKDGVGNEYKIVGGSLYVLGWQDASVKVRMVTCETGKEVPSKGRKFQIYGWHLVQKIEDVENCSNEVDVTKFEKEVKFDREVDQSSENRTNEQKEKQPEDLKKNKIVYENKTVGSIVETETETEAETVKLEEKDAKPVEDEKSSDADTPKTVAVSKENSSIKKKKRLI